MNSLKKMYHAAIWIIILIGLVMIFDVDIFPWDVHFSNHTYIEDANVVIFILACDYVLRFWAARWKTTRHHLKSAYRRVTKDNNHRWLVFLRKFVHRTKELLKTNGLGLLLLVSLAILITSAIVFSLAENQSIGTGLWWAITTATTVGYGDVSPHTVIGKLMASILMIGGIGFIGTLTSTISEYVTRDRDDSTVILRKLAAIEKQNRALKKQITRIERRNNKK